MEKIYFYPQFDYTKARSPNPYIVDFQRALSSHYTIINKKSNYIGVLDFFKYLFKTDIYIFNWIEDLPVYRYGKLQSVFFLFFLMLCKLFNKKIIWVLHNKYSHFLNKNFWTDLLYSVLMAYSDLILTHSKNGIEFGEEYYPKQAHKINYICHPINQLFSQCWESKKKYDFLIWGSISSYKGILEFLQFVGKNRDLYKPRILIVGKCIQENYKNQLKPFLSKDILMIDRYFEMEEITKLANQSRFILFTHKATSVLSSGTLIDSIRMQSRIIGPDMGAFKDLKALSCIETYEKYEDILEINNRYLDVEKQIDPNELEKFYKENNWEEFSNKIHELLKNC